MKQDPNRFSKLDMAYMTIVKDMLSIRYLKSELLNRFLAFYDAKKNEKMFESFLAKLEINIEVLEMLGKNYPEMLTHNWPTLKVFLQQVFGQTDHKLKLACLKMVEEWLNNFNKDYNVSDSDSKRSDFGEKFTKESSSSNTISKISEDEDKLSHEILEFYQQKDEILDSPTQGIELAEISPFKYDDFCECLNDIFAYFLDESDMTKGSDILVNSSQNNENKGVFITMRVVTATNSLYYKKFGQNFELIPDIIKKLFVARNEVNTQV